jgi:hypothetical protein
MQSTTKMFVVAGAKNVPHVPPVATNVIAFVDTIVLNRPVITPVTSTRNVTGFPDAPYVPPPLVKLASPKCALVPQPSGAL